MTDPLESNASPSSAPQDAPPPAATTNAASDPAPSPLRGACEGDDTLDLVIDTSAGPPWRAFWSPASDAQPGDVVLVALDDLGDEEPTS